MPNQEALLGLDEAAALLNLKPPTLRKWIHLKRIPVVRLGFGPKRRVRFRRSALVRFIQAHEQGIGNRKRSRG